MRTNSLIDNQLRTKHRLYGVWNAMMCNYRDDVCTRWNKLENFIEDMDQAYIRNMWFTRRDKTKKYTKDNCFWDEPNNQKKGCAHSNNLAFMQQKQKQKIDSLVAETLRQRRG